jgi:hypothetical protein
MWIDIEAAIADAKRKYRIVSIEEAVDLHIAAIEAWIGTLEARCWSAYRKWANSL